MVARLLSVCDSCKVGGDVPTRMHTMILDTNMLEEAVERYLHVH